MRTFIFVLFIFSLFADPLPSWNEGETKNAILEFVKKSTDSHNPNFIPPSNRIVTFDQDGTLWVEHPLYAQAEFALARIAILAPSHPEWKQDEPFKSILDSNKEQIAKFKEEDWAKIIALTHTGMSTVDFQNIVNKWIEEAKHPRFNRKYTELVYKPMLEVINYLRESGFKVYIVTGGGQEFVRVFSDSVYHIPPENVIGSSVNVNFEYKDGNPVLMRLPKVFFIDDHKGKPIGINLFIGKTPVAAFGNSDGDKEMLEWTQGTGGKLMMLVHHDDPVREYAYGQDTSVGTFSDNLKEKAKKNGWIIISMKNDWKTIFEID